MKAKNLTAEAQSPQRTLQYSSEESDRAYRDWHASCGPHSLAAACGITLDAVRAVLPVPFKGWMSPTMMGNSLRALGQPFSLRTGLKTMDLCEGINRIQWEGKWLNPGVPARVAYFHTHWVAHFGGWVLCTACLPDQWISVPHWLRILLKTESPSPFHITHHYTLESEVRA